jgi:cell division protein DivIC
MKHRIKSFFKWGVLLLSLILALSLVKSITKIVGSNQKIVDEQTSVTELKKENEDLARQLQAVKTTQFVETQARDKLGLAKKGEIVLVLPDEATLKSLAPKIKEEKFTLPAPIWQKWLKLFL